MKPLIDLLYAKEPEFQDHIVIKRSKRAKRLALRLDSQKRVFNLVLPRGFSLRAAQRFVQDHEEWMQDKLEALAPQIPLAHSTTIPVFGEDTLIQVNFDKDLKRTRIVLKDNTLSVHTNQEDPNLRIVRFLKKTAKEKLTYLSGEKAAVINKTIRSIQVRDTKTRWGSCSQDGRLSFSWRLIFAPYESLDYVVAHEVAHLVHLNHSKKFWELCEELSENYTIGKNWMKKHGHSLMCYQ